MSALNDRAYDYYRRHTGFGKEIGTKGIDTDAWDRGKSVRDLSLFHGVFTRTVPSRLWKEMLDDVEQTTITKATSVNGKLNLVSGTLNQKVALQSFRHPRYEPNRGALYSSSIFLPNPVAAGQRSFGQIYKESGSAFRLRSGTLYAVVRTYVDSVISDIEEEIIIPDYLSLDLSKGNTFDIQYEWRGTGNYFFFINDYLVHVHENLGTNTELSQWNPASPASFECINQGDEVVIQAGCIDISSEGGDDNSKAYGSIGITTQSGEVAISGFNSPVLVVRAKKNVSGTINTRDTLALAATAGADAKGTFRIWTTRDWTAITENDQVWQDFGDGHLEYLEYDNPNVATPMTFDTSKADLSFGSPIAANIPFISPALFERRTELYLTPGDMFIFTVHKNSGASGNGSVTFELAESI